MTNIPPGWYPAPHDPAVERYYNGTQWVGDERPRQNAPVAGAPPRDKPKSSLTILGPDAPKKSRKGLLIGAGSVLGVLLLIGIIGAATGTPVKDSPEYQDQAEALAAAETQVGDLQAQVDQIEGDLPTREQALEDGMAEVERIGSETIAKMDERATELDAVAADLAGREKKVSAREKAVGATENQIAENTVPGDGTYLVGDDIRAGSYRSEDNSDCYWEVTSDAGGANIVNNDIGSGTRFAEVREGQYFSSTFCNDWVLQ